MAGVGKRTYLRDVNPYLICPLCRGYLIDATTVVECLHSFCRSCILKHLGTEAYCPSCQHVLNKAKPNIKADKALQDIVYKLVPGLYHKEMRRRREFYKRHPEHADVATPEQRGEDVSGRLIFAPEDAVSLSLEYLPPGADPLTILLSTNDTDSSHSNANNHNHSNINNNSAIATNSGNNRRYLQCPALVTIAHLKKFLALKYSVDMTRYTIEICHRRAPLPEHWTLMDVAYIYAWKRNAPMRFFYRVAQEEQTLEAPSHERPSTPGLGASLPPIGNTMNPGNDDEDLKSDVAYIKSEDNKMGLQEGKSASMQEKLHPREIDNRLNETQEISNQNVNVTDRSTLTSTTTTTAIAVMTNTLTNTTNDDAKHIKTPIKILKNPNGKYEVLKSPSTEISWNSKDQNSIVEDVKTSSSPEFSVVSIGDGQNSNGVKITLKQCSPGSTGSSKKPKIISNVLYDAKNEKDPTGGLLLQHLQKDKQKRRVSFVDKIIPTKANINVPRNVAKKSIENPDKKQFLQSFQLTARESIVEKVLIDTTPAVPATNTNATNEVIVAHAGSNVAKKKEIDVIKVNPTKTNENSEEKKKTISNDISVKSESKNDNKRNNVVTPMNNNGRNNSSIKQSGDIEMQALDVHNSKHINSKISSSSSSTTTTVTTVTTTTTTIAPTNIPNNTNNPNNPAKVDVYTFPGDPPVVPPVVPAGAVKRKCPPGLPIFEVKRKKQQSGQTQTIKKANLPPPNPTKTSRKCATNITPTKKPVISIGDAGSNRASNVVVATAKAQSNSIFSNDTRNLLDGCGLNIPASLSITLTAPKSPGNNNGAAVNSNDSKDNRKNVVGKVSPSITLNDRCVDPRVLKALKTGQIRMPAPPKPKQLKQTDREISYQRQLPGNKRKRDQESRDILDLSSGKKMDIHPLRIPQPVTKLKAKSPVRENLPGISDQGQVVTLMGGHRYYRAPPGSLTPAVHRVNDCPSSPSGRTPVYAPSGIASSLSGSRTNATSLSSVFPSLQSLYALSQAPNLQQFQMDARLRLSRNGENTTSGIPVPESMPVSSNIPGKSHLAAQCAPVKPARSSVASLAVPVTKQQSSERTIPNCTNRPTVNENNKNDIVQNKDVLDSTDSCQRLSTTQAKYSLTTEGNNDYSQRNVNNISSNNNGKPFLNSTHDVRTESAGNSVNEPDHSTRQQQQQQRHREAASPRVSSTASPSPPPSNNGANVNDNKNESNRDNDSNNDTDFADKSDRTRNSVPTATSLGKTTLNMEVTSIKSPASPDSSSVTIESPVGKNCTTVDRQASSFAQEINRSKLSDLLTKVNNVGTDDSFAKEEKKSSNPIKQSDAKQMTSEMLQKRLLAAFPSNEWANNPIAAEHLGNFLKSLNASMKSETNIADPSAEKDEDGNNSPIKVRGDENVSSNLQKDIGEQS